MVPLVFKTSLGAVRFPEGSTPSLLRHCISLAVFSLSKSIAIFFERRAPDIFKVDAGEAQAAIRRRSL